MLCLFCSLAIRDIFHTPMARYGLFVLTVPLNAHHLTDLSHIVNSCPLTKFDGGLLRLHEADEAAVDWLTTYGS